MILSDHELSISRIIEAPRATVWKAWTIAEHFEKWWAPAPVKTKVGKMDVVAGGAFDNVIQMPDGSSHMARGVFLNVVPEKIIVFTDAMTEGWIPSGAGFMTAFITMSDHEVNDDGESKVYTKYDARIAHKSEEEMTRHKEMGFHEGWGQALAQLNDVAKEIG
ncbi:SRPBCC domain-containing protein [Lentilitoribacter sp. EG35]|uniref:SRPBCC domain-containing protein n=1 Tax=Lentilitoribacter sp. EG35 TaxID=3234192 RepID=UPI00346130F1